MVKVEVLDKISLHLENTKTNHAQEEGMRTLNASFLLSILFLACSGNRTAVPPSVRQPDGGILMPDAKIGMSTLNEAETTVIKPDPLEPEVVGLGERCTDGVNACETGLICNNGFCLGNSGWACSEHQECADYLRCRDKECRHPARADGSAESACEDTSDCEEDAICSNGLCRYPLGHWCPNNGSCAEGLICSQWHCRVPEDGLCASTADCVWYTFCRDPDGDGASQCTRQELYGVCRFDRQCSAGQLCDAGIDASICLTAEGAICTEETCVGGARCVPLGGDVHGCAEPALGRGCDNNLDCPEGAVCVENRCGYPIFHPCSDTDECHPGLICDETAGMCLRHEGAVCEEGECGVPFRCRPTLLSDGLPRCLEPEVGGPCADNADCPTDTSCRGGRCVRGIGERCTSSFECEEGVAVCQPHRNAGCAGLFCGPHYCYLVDSAPCTDDDHCAWGMNCVPADRTDPEGVHLCRPRIPGIGCDSASECPSNIPCTNHRCIIEHGGECSGSQPCDDGLECRQEVRTACNEWPSPCAGEYVNDSFCRYSCESSTYTSCTNGPRCPALCTDIPDIFNCSEDSAWLTPAEGGAYLAIPMLTVWDNGEGSGGIHGPEGNLYACFMPCHLLDSLTTLPDDIFAQVQCRPLRGPHWTGEDSYGHKCEWIDNETVRYDSTSCLLYHWNPEYDQGCVVLMIYESDSCSPWGPASCSSNSAEGTCECCFIFCGSRSHDIMGAVEIHRAATEASCGATYDLYAYTEYPPRTLRCQPGSPSCSPSMQITLQTITP